MIDGQKHLNQIRQSIGCYQKESKSPRRTGCMKNSSRTQQCSEVLFLSFVLYKLIKALSVCRQLTSLTKYEN